MRVLVLVTVACGARPAIEPVRNGTPIIDRFSAAAGHLMVRDKRPGLPAPNAPIDFDRPPFVTRGLGPDGAHVRYYNFDVQSDAPGTLYRFTRGGAPIDGQPDLVDTLPGEPGYSDFWRISSVEVPTDFPPITRVAQLAGLAVKASTTIIDCPIVPRGSTARGGDHVAPPTLRELAVRGERVVCFDFATSLTGERVPTSPIYVTFASEAGPASGFRTEASSPQTHNVVLSVPGDTDYSPLWAVHIYDRRAFDLVHDAATAQRAREVEQGPLVNCPIISIGAP